MTPTQGAAESPREEADEINAERAMSTTELRRTQIRPVIMTRLTSCSPGIHCVVGISRARARNRLTNRPLRTAWGGVNLGRCQVGNWQRQDS